MGTGRDPSLEPSGSPAAQDTEAVVAFPDARVTHATDWALRVCIGAKTAWVPRDCIVDRSLHHPGDRGTLVVARALAQELGLF